MSTYVFCEFLFFFFNDSASTEIYTLSLHDALPILGAQCDAGRCLAGQGQGFVVGVGMQRLGADAYEDRKSTRLNSSHLGISYAVFCLKKKNQNLVSIPTFDRKERTISLMPRTATKT